MLRALIDKVAARLQGNIWEYEKGIRTWKVFSGKFWEPASYNYNTTVILLNAKRAVMIYIT